MQGTTIEITLWRGIADKFYDHIEEGQVCSFIEYTWVAFFSLQHTVALWSRPETVHPSP